MRPNGELTWLLTNNLEALGWYRQAQQLYCAQGDTSRVHRDHEARRSVRWPWTRRYLERDQFDASCLRFTAQTGHRRRSGPRCVRRMEAILDRDDTHAAALESPRRLRPDLRHDWAECDALHRT